MPTPKKTAKPRKTLQWNGAVPPQVAVRDLKVDAIYRVAASAFRRNGYHGTSLEDIAKQLGIGKATLYYYFANKQELLFQCHLAAADQAIASVHREAGVNGLERLRRSIADYVASIIGPESYSVVILEERSLTDAQLKLVIRKRDEFERLLHGAVQDGIADGSILPGDPKFAVFVALGASNWVTKWYRPEGAWTVDQVAQAAAYVVVRGLATEPARLVPVPPLIGGM